jgi:hypothetical protein
MIAYALPAANVRTPERQHLGERLTGRLLKPDAPVCRFAWSKATGIVARRQRSKIWLMQFLRAAT